MDNFKTNIKTECTNSYQVFSIHFVLLEGVGKQQVMWQISQLQVEERGLTFRGLVFVTSRHHRPFIASTVEIVKNIHEFCDAWSETIESIRTYASMAHTNIYSPNWLNCFPCHCWQTFLTTYANTGNSRKLHSKHNCFLHFMQMLDCSKFFKVHTDIVHTILVL